MKFKYSKSNEEILNQLKAIYLYMSHLIHGQIERASETIIRNTLNKSAPRIESTLFERKRR